MNKILLVLFLFTSSTVFAWGGRGHHAICETAVFLVKNKNLKNYLDNKPHMMGHLCNIPDTYWRSISGEVNKLGAPTHYIDIELIGLKINEIPTDYKKIIADHTGKPNKAKEGATIFSVPTEFGSLWWRADQFTRRIVALGPQFKDSAPPTNSKEEQDDNLPFNKMISQMIVDMGLMGHFVGDAAQPLHNTLDYDGYMSGHGGIHAYYEDAIVSQFDGDLSAKVLAEARLLKKPAFLKPATTVEKMKALSEISSLDIKKIFAADPIIQPSEVKKEKGMEIKKAAIRKPADVAFKKLDKLIITQLARASVLLAHLWDESYEKAGEPKLAAYKSYKFPFTPDFVAPDYFDIETKEQKKQ